MTTVNAENIHVIALEGTFDDCQTIVKALFNHTGFRAETRLSGVNSINFARVLVQIVYYFTAALSLGAPLRPVSFAVPTGNFGDIFAGWMAKKMGLPVEWLVIATNSNDILVRSLRDGVYEPHKVHVTQSPSMDIQISSNFERLLFELCSRNPGVLRRQMELLAQSGRFELVPDQLSAFRQQFSAFMANETETTSEIGRIWEESGILIDPHTAVGVHAARQTRVSAETPMIVLGTAHPAKFPDAVRRATGQHPKLPEHLSGLLERREEMTILPNDESQVAQFIRGRSRVMEQPKLRQKANS
jgi:threonine synthase